MKIIRIELQNINSLKSESPIIIDFESEKFRDVGLFAITGHTGAGKTTILDAITIALYHQVPRFNKTNIKAGLKDVISFGATHALSRVVFDNKHVRYEAQWSMRIATSTGRLLTNPVEEVRLKDLTNSKIIAEKKLDVKNTIEKITQLNYNQFLRSVMLAQGEFAAFVSAKASDKGRLLEQITGEYIYKKIGETIVQKKYDEQKKLDNIKSEINSNDILSNEQQKLLTNEKQIVLNEINKINNELISYEQIINWNKKQTELNAQLERIKEERIKHQDNKKNKNQILELLKKHEKAEPFKNTLSEIDRLQNEIIKQKANNSTIENKLNEISKKITENEKAVNSKQNMLSDFESDFKEWIPKLEKVSVIDTKIKTLNKTQISLSQNIEQLSTLYNNLSTELNNKKTEKEKSEKLLIDINNYLKQQELTPRIKENFDNWKVDLALIKEITSQINSETQLISKNENNIKLLNTELIKKKTKISNYHKSTQTLSEKLELLKSEIEEITLYELINKQNSIKDKIIKWDKLNQLSINYTQQNQVKEKLLAKIKQLQEDLIKYKNKVYQFEIEQEKVQISVNDAKKIIELEKKIKDFEKERKQLKLGQPCPLCGSTDHPYVKNYSGAEISELELELSKRQTQLDNLIKLKNTTTISQNTAETKLTEIKKQLTTTTNEVIKTEDEAKNLSLNCRIYDKNTITKNLESLKNEHEEIKNKIITLQEVENKIETIKNKQEKYNQEINALNTEITKLEENITNKQNLIKETRANLAKHRSKYQLKTDNLTNSITSFNLKTPIKPEEYEDFIAYIEKLINNYHKAEKRQLDENQKISELRIAIKNTEQNKDEKQTEIKNLQVDYNNTSIELNELTKSRVELIPIDVSTEDKRNELESKLTFAKKELEIAKVNLQQLITEQSNKETQKKDIQTTILKLQNELNSYNKQLSTDLQNSCFNTQSEIRDALLDNETLLKIQEIKKSLNNEELRINTLEQKLKIDLAELEKTKKIEESVENIIKKYEQLKIEKEQKLKRIGEIDQRFDTDKQIKQRNKDVYERIVSQEKVVKKWTDLLLLLGGSKDAFNTYVQRLTLKNLIHLANIHLHKLNARYSLMMNKTYSKGEELSFKLIDHYQTDETRLVDTCSGGEKFLISLALALGLSDLASKNVNIDSLFIDEGFGSLDNSTLETVISTLETLQAQGKIIGVISHVENMKERISTQIKVIKKSNGISKVEIV